ncbi:hypothetical protein [Piscinibacter koreensis]|uniref:Uncharacterized protein n=1 Tax=Piscinibacter koreensis TaxID=2742824 RepID=A0A7Y6TWB0_9BURK|nr:hypothetical protein [Schlegelella koreensis]NUZ05900.1 hypothetical protein [Schlegelella koreensis]
MTTTVQSEPASGDPHVRGCCDTGEAVVAGAPADRARQTPADHGEWHERTAEVVVHGVADQEPGTTLESVVSLLVASSAGSTYSRVKTVPLTLKVPPLCVSTKPRGDPNVDKTLAILGPAEARTGVYVTTAIHVRRDAQVLADGTSVPATTVHLHEMYWADLSRLSGSVPRIVSEVFTLIFRLSRLARETIDNAAPSAGGRRRRGEEVEAQPRVTGGLRGRDAAPKRLPWHWRPLWRLQPVLDGVLVHVVAMLFLTLALLGFVVVGLGLSRTLDGANIVRLPAYSLAGSALALILAAAFVSLRASGARKVTPLAVAAVLLMVGAWRVSSDPSGQPWAARWAIFGFLMLMAALIHWAVVAAARRRFPFRTAWASVWGLGAAIVVSVDAILAYRELDAAGLASMAPGDFSLWMRSTLLGIELVLLATKWVWIVLGGLLGVWFGSSVLACCVATDYRQRGAIATGRLGLGMSVLGFLIVSMIIWAGISQALAKAAEGIEYQPRVFVQDLRAVRTATDPAANGHAESRCAATPSSSSLAPRSADAVEPPRAPVRPESMDASCFLKVRFDASTEAFAPAALLLRLLLVYLLVMFVPSILSEFGVKLGRNEHGTPGGAYQLGRWLTRCLAAFDAVVGTVIAASVAVAVVVAALFMSLTDVGDSVREWSQLLLKPFVITAASLGALLVAFGGVLSKHLPSVRAPLDVVLDVDNYFRVFPTSNVPRANMMARFSALLDRLEQEGFRSIVIVAHSQGSVLAADLVRLRAATRPRQGSPASYHFVTFGTPLRQLYAARFRVGTSGCCTDPRSTRRHVRTRWVGRALKRRASSGGSTGTAAATTSGVGCGATSRW